MHILLSWIQKVRDLFFGAATAYPKRRYNWVKDKFDFRDITYTYAPSDFPSSVDLRAKCPPVVNQGDLGSCTANALAGALGFLELQEEAAGQTNQPEEFGTDFIPFSRLFIYWNERMIEGDPTQDNGAQLRDGIKSLVATGACSEITWPYDPSLAFKQPTPASFAEAANHKISLYQSLDGTDIAALKSCLALGYPFVFGFQVFESFESDSVASTGIVPIPTTNEQRLGGHAVMCVGYSDQTRMFIVRNSWGPYWGDKGYFYLPYDFMTNPDLTDDFWTVRR